MPLQRLIEYDKTPVLSGIFSCFGLEMPVNASVLN